MSALGEIAQHVVDAVKPLEAALSDPGAFRALLLRLGWRATDIPPGWAALSAHVTSLETAVAGLADDPQLEDVAAALVSIDELRTQLGTLSTAPPGIDRDALIGELRELLVERLVIDQIARAAPRTYGLLLAFGLIKIERQPATPDRPAHRRYRFDTDRLVALIEDPSSLPELVYDWGLASFDVERVTGVLFELVIRLGLRATLDHTNGTFPGYPDLPIGQSVIRLPLMDTVLEGQPFHLGLGLAVLPPAQGGPGLVIAPRIPGLTDGGLQLAPNVSLKAVTATGAPIELALVITPAGLALKFPGTGTLGDGIGVEMTFATPGRLGTSSGTRFELAGLTLGLYADQDDDGFVARFAARVDGAKIVMAGGDQDGIVARLVGDRDLEIPFPLGIQWSSHNGFELTLGPGTLNVPGSFSLGPLRFDNIALGLSTGDHDIAATVAARVTTTLGPLAIILDRLGARVRLDRSVPGVLGLGSLDAGVALPTGAGIAVNTKLVSGGGQIDRDPQTGRYSGAIGLQMFRYQVLAAAILDTRTPEGRALTSFVALASVRFPGVPLIMGVMLDGLGGVLGIHRRADDQRMRDALRAGKLADLLLPDDPQLGLANLLVQLGDLFPIAEGRFVAGPSARLGWGTPRFMTADVLVLLEGPSPLRVLVLASAALGLPTLDKRVVDLRIDALGVVDLDRGTVAVDASLHDSKIAGTPISGDLALRASFASPRNLILSIGGFHPRFTPPAGFPALRRVELVAGDNPQLRMSAYLARTPNSVQVGAQVDLAATGGGFVIKAHLGFDALFEIHPFHFDVDIEASADVSWHGHHLLGLDLSFQLTGPHPYHAKGHASFSILWWDVSVGFDHTWGDGSPDALPPAPDLSQILRDALIADDAWTSELPAGEPSWLVVGGDTRSVHPFATVVVVERALPLDHDITMYSSLPTSPQRFSIDHVSVTVGSSSSAIATTPVDEPFAPGQFTSLSQDEQLSAPSFEDFHAGVRIGDDAIRVGPTSHSSLAMDTIEIDPLAPPPVVTKPPFIITGTFMSRADRRPAAAAVVAPALHALAYTLASTDTLQPHGSPGTYAGLRASAGARVQIVPVPYAKS